MEVLRRNGWFLGRLDFGESWVDGALGWGLEVGCLVFGTGFGGFGCEVRGDMVLARRAGWMGRGTDTTPRTHHAMIYSI